MGFAHARAMVEGAALSEGLLRAHGVIRNPTSPTPLFLDIADIVPLRIQGNMVVSLNRGLQYRTQHAIILNMGTPPKKVTLILRNPKLYMGIARKPRVEVFV